MCASPTPGGFWQRVRKHLRTNEIAFCTLQKSAHMFEKKGDRSETRWNVPRSERLNVEGGFTCSEVVPEWELLVYTPAVFVRVASKGLTRYGTWKKVRKMEGRVGTSRRPNVQTPVDEERKGKRTARAGITGLAGVSSINHDSCYHELYCLSSINIVLALSKRPYLFERFCKAKKTKG
jgi:hypothetical protein